ncbi:MAG: insulinase family protein [Deltaproteobacteria bacterium]
MRLRSLGHALLTASCVGAYLWTGGCQRAAPAPAETVRDEVTTVEPAASAPTLPLDRALETRVLENGVTYLSRRFSATTQRVVLGLVVKVGALVEADDEQGLAHFVEHMAFDGTTHYDGKELRSFFGRVGLNFGGHANAFTSQTSTRFLLEIPSDDPATLDQAVLILRDWATGIRFDPAAVERVRPVLIAEKRAHDTPQERLTQRMTKLAMQGSRHAARDVIGLESVIQSASAEQLRSFYRRWYQPQNLAVVANGDFDGAAMQRRVEQHFGSLQKAESPLTPPHFEVPVSAIEHVVVDSDPELQGSLCLLTLKRKAQTFATEDDYRRLLRDRLLLWMLQRRLEPLPRVAEAPVTSASATFAMGEVGTYDLLQLVAEPRREQEGGALGQLIGELERVARHGFQTTELERARPALALEWVANLKKDRRIRETALQLMQHFLSGNAVLAPPDEVEISQRLLASISLDEVDQQAIRWVQESERYHMVIGRDAGSLPTEAALRAAAAGVRRAPLGPYKEATLVAPLMAAPPASGTIVSEGHIAAIDTYDWRLSNGARVVFKAIDEAPGSISLRAFSPGGTARGRHSDLPGLRLTASMISELGLGSHDALSIQRLLNDVGIRIVPWIEDKEEGVDASGTRDRLEMLFQALHLTLSAPGRDAAAWAASRGRIRERLGDRLANPDAFFSAAISQRARGDALRFGPLPPEAVDQVSLDSLRAFYLERFGDVGDFTFVFVGDSRPAELRPLVEQYLASLPGTPRREAASRSEAYYHPGVTRVRVQQGRGDKGTVTVIFHGDERLPSSVREDLQTLRDYLETRLRESLREDLGGVYTVQVWAELRNPPRQGHEVGLRFDCRPDQCESLKQAALAVITEIARAGVPRGEIDVLRSQLARSAEVRPQKLLFWQEELGNAYRRGLDPAEIVATFKNGARISSAALQASARRYLRLDQYVDALLLPERQTSAPGAAAPTATP